MKAGKPDIRINHLSDFFFEGRGGLYTGKLKAVNFLSFLCLSFPERNLDTKKTTPNKEVCPESLGAMLEYWYMYI